MGTTGAFYHIMNRGFDKAHLQDGLNRLYEGKPASQLEEMEALLKSLMGEEKFQQFQQEEARLNSERGLDAVPELPSPMAAYRRDAAWLPFFDRDLCEGFNASSESIRRLSEAFRAPILAFSIFDSDVLMLPCCDAAENIAYDYAKPNFDDMDEFDDETFQYSFPQFLTGLCPGTSERELRGIWDAEEVFADDRMIKLYEALGAVPVYDELPEGFEAITLSEN